MVHEHARLGAGSLRQAITDSDNSPGKNTIKFTITPAAASYTIDLQTPLPAITHPVLIDGTSQTGYSVTPIIEINGGGLTGDGLLLASGSDGSTIKGLAIANFAGAGIHIQSNDNLIQSNFLGTDLTGTIALGNQNGLFIDGGSGNTIGGSSTGAGNLVSANQSYGISLSSSAPMSSRATTWAPTFQMAALGNGSDGITDSSAEQHDWRQQHRGRQPDLGKSRQWNQRS